MLFILKGHKVQFSSFKNIDRCYLGPELIVYSENGRPSTVPSKGSFDYVHADGMWSSHWETNGGGYPKGVVRATFSKNSQYVVNFTSNDKTISDQKSRALLIWQILQKFIREQGLPEMFISCAIFELTVSNYKSM